MPHELNSSRKQSARCLIKEFTQLCTTVTRSTLEYEHQAGQWPPKRSATHANQPTLLVPGLSRRCPYRNVCQAHRKYNYTPTAPPTGTEYRGPSMWTNANRHNLKPRPHLDTANPRKLRYKPTAPTTGTEQREQSVRTSATERCKRHCPNCVRNSCHAAPRGEPGCPGPRPRSLLRGAGTLRGDM